MARQISFPSIHRTERDQTEIATMPRLFMVLSLIAAVAAAGVVSLFPLVLLSNQRVAQKKDELRPQAAAGLIPSNLKEAQQLVLTPSVSTTPTTKVLVITVPRVSQCGEELQRVAPTATGYKQWQYTTEDSLAAMDGLERVTLEEATRLLKTPSESFLKRADADGCPAALETISQALTASEPTVVLLTQNIDEGAKQLVGRQLQAKKPKKPVRKNELNVAPHEFASILVIAVFTAIILIGITCLMDVDGPAVYEDKTLAINKEF